MEGGDIGGQGELPLGGLKGRLPAVADLVGKAQEGDRREPDEEKRNEAA